MQQFVDQFVSQHGRFEEDKAAANVGDVALEGPEEKAEG